MHLFLLKGKGQKSRKYSRRYLYYVHGVFHSTSAPRGKGSQNRPILQTNTRWNNVHHFSKVASLSRGNFFTPYSPLSIMCKSMLTKLPKK